MDLWNLARPERFELPTPWFVARYSIQLSYGRTVQNPLPATGQILDNHQVTGDTPAADGAVTPRPVPSGARMLSQRGQPQPTTNLCQRNSTISAPMIDMIIPAG
jgi:hypothetical protein